MCADLCKYGICPGMLTLGRDGMRILCLELYYEAHLRQTLHFHQRNLTHDVIPEGEGANDLSRQLE